MEQVNVNVDILKKLVEVVDMLSAKMDTFGKELNVFRSILPTKGVGNSHILYCPTCTCAVEPAMPSIAAPSVAASGAALPSAELLPPPAPASPPATLPGPGNKMQPPVPAIPVPAVSLAAIVGRSLPTIAMPTAGRITRSQAAKGSQEGKKSSGTSDTGRPAAASTSTASASSASTSAASTSSASTSAASTSIPSNGDPPPSSDGTKTDVQLSDQASGSHPWTLINRKKRPISVRGSQRNLEELKYYHLYPLHPDTSLDDMTSYIQSITTVSTSSFKVSKIKSRGEYASFKLGVPASAVQDVVKSKHWPKHSFLKEWVNNIITPRLPIIKPS